MRINHLLGLALTSSISIGVQATPNLNQSGAYPIVDTTLVGQYLARRGADDVPNHDVGDDRGRHRGGRMFEQGSEHEQLARRGADDGVNHDVGDDRGRNRG